MKKMTNKVRYWKYLVIKNRTLIVGEFHRLGADILTLASFKSRIGFADHI